jgi:hypothetical protein
MAAVTATVKYFVPGSNAWGVAYRQKRGCAKY